MLSSSGTLDVSSSRVSPSASSSNGRRTHICTARLSLFEYARTEPQLPVCLCFILKLKKKKVTATRLLLRKAKPILSGLVHQHSRLIGGQRIFPVYQPLP
jgi:hypothetical protein